MRKVFSALSLEKTKKKLPGFIPYISVDLYDILTKLSESINLDCGLVPNIVDLQAIASVISIKLGGNIFSSAF